MLEKAASFISDNRLFEVDPLLIVGVSGGPDSVCALVVLQKLGYRVVCVHFDHQLRPGSAADAQFVEKTAAELGVAFAGGKVDVAAYAGENQLSVEEAGRLLRYRFLFDRARQLGAEAVVTGHSADDQVETVLMHFLRGAGLSGLKGMLPSTILASFDPEIPIVRPLLFAWRKEILAFCREAGLSFLDDPSNAETTYFRNRLRHELLPLLETYNPGIRQTILRSAGALSLEDAALEDAVWAAWEGVYRAASADYIRLDRAAFQALHVGVRARVLRLAASHLRPSLRDLDYAGILRGLDAAAAETQFRAADLGGGLSVLVEGGSVWLAAGWDALPTDSWPFVPFGSARRLDVPGETSLGGGWALAATWADADAEAVAGIGSWTVLLDADSLDSGLSVRARQPGDRFDPAGMAGHTMKLADFMINEKLPKRARAGWPLVVSGDRIIWVAGMRMANHAAPGVRTKRRLKLHLFRR